MQQPDREKGSSACNTEPLENPTTETDSIVQEVEQERKQFETLRARAALAGHELVQVSSGYMLMRWTHSKHVTSLEAVDMLLRRMGAQP